MDEVHATKILCQKQLESNCVGAYGHRSQRRLCLLEMSCRIPAMRRWKAGYLFSNVDNLPHLWNRRLTLPDHLADRGNQAGDAFVEATIKFGLFP